jgi:ankyrin repeat protein
VLFHAARAIPGSNRRDGLETLRLLLAHGADIRARNLSGKTMLQAAEETDWASDAVLEFLRSAEA